MECFSIDRIDTMDNTRVICCLYIWCECESWRDIGKDSLQRRNFYLKNMDQNFHCLSSRDRIVWYEGTDPISGNDPKTSSILYVSTIRCRRLDVHIGCSIIVLFRYSYDISGHIDSWNGWGNRYFSDCHCIGYMYRFHLHRSEHEFYEFSSGDFILYREVLDENIYAKRKKRTLLLFSSVYFFSEIQVLSHIIIFFVCLSDGFLRSQFLCNSRSK